MNFFGEAVDWFGTAAKKVGTVLGDVTETIAGLPNEIVGFADRLAGAQREAARGAVEQQRQFEQRRLFGEYGPFILLGGVGLIIWALNK